MEERHLYLWLMAGSLLGPLLRSFESRIAFYRSFGPLFLAILSVSSLFVVWDIIFTARGYWGFNPRYLSGISLLGLPLGEYLFFIIIPFCCVFIYRVLNYFWPRLPWNFRITRHISVFLLGFSGALAVSFHQRWYTLITFSLLFILIYFLENVRKVPWLGHFYRAYAVILIPFFLVNGILTGTGLEEEIVWYNEDELIGIRLLSIPLEDAFYGMALIMGVVALYEYWGRKWGYNYWTRTE